MSCLLTDEALSSFGIVQNLAWGGAVPAIAERLGWDAQAVVSRIREAEAPTAAVRRFSLTGQIEIEGVIEVQAELREALGDGLDEVLKAALEMLTEVLRAQSQILVTDAPDPQALSGEWVQTSVRVLSGEDSFEIQQYVRPGDAQKVVNAFSSAESGTGESAMGQTQPSDASSQQQPPVARYAWQPIAGAGAPVQTAGPESLSLLYDIPLTLRAELGRTQKRVEEIVSLGPGMVIELDRAVGEAVDIYANGQWVARGEVVVVEDNFAVRITEIGSTQDRASKLRLREGS